VYTMKTIIAGSRDLVDKDTVFSIIDLAPVFITQIISGGARGIDKLGAEFGYHKDIPVITFNADWDTYGKRAGYLRNVDMADNAEALIAIWDGKSKGTKHMIDIALDKGLLVYVKKVGA